MKKTFYILSIGLFFLNGLPFFQNGPNLFFSQSSKGIVLASNQIMSSVNQANFFATKNFQLTQSLKPIKNSNSIVNSDTDIVKPSLYKIRWDMLSFPQ